jgi:hypothetical protein
LSTPQDIPRGLLPRYQPTTSRTCRLS